jgi:hypothetical protein
MSQSTEPSVSTETSMEMPLETTEHKTFGEKTDNDVEMEDNPNDTATAGAEDNNNPNDTGSEIPSGELNEEQIRILEERMLKTYGGNATFKTLGMHVIIEDMREQKKYSDEQRGRVTTVYDKLSKFSEKIGKPLEREKFFNIFEGVKDEEFLQTFEGLASYFQKMSQTPPSSEKATEEKKTPPKPEPPLPDVSKKSAKVTGSLLMPYPKGPQFNPNLVAKQTKGGIHGKTVYQFGKKKQSKRAPLPKTTTLAFGMNKDIMKQRELLLKFRQARKECPEAVLGLRRQREFKATFGENPNK